MLRNEELHGYVLHSRPYRENSRIIHFYSLEYGRIDGVYRKTLPALYQACHALCSGLRELKSFNQIEQTGQLHLLHKEALFAGFYINELMIKLLPMHDASTVLFAAYTQTVQQLAALQDDKASHQLKVILRHFEKQLLMVLGYQICFNKDQLQQAIDPDGFYTFDGEYFIRDHRGRGELGLHLCAIAQLDIISSPEELGVLGRVHRYVLNRILGDKPLKSRELWIGAKQEIKQELGQSTTHTPIL